MKTAVIHEWLTAYAGSERVVEQVLDLYPGSDLYVLVDFLSDTDRRRFAYRHIHTSFVQNLPFAKNHFRGYLPLLPLAVEQFDLSGYDLIISSNHAVAKGVITGPDQLHISYVHSPMRYAWDLQHQYLRESGRIRGLRSWLIRWVLHKLRLWDVRSAYGVDWFVANSRFIARRIRKTYRREAEVIHPPVDVAAFGLKHSKEDYYLAASRLVPYKRMDLVVRAFNQLGDRRLVVIGDGPQMDSIRRYAGENIRVLGYQDDATLVHHLQNARGFVFAAEEDFGILPVEAQACGTPVIAYDRGGVGETVVDGRTGCFFSEQSIPAICDAVRRFEAMEHQFDPAAIRRHAEQFSKARFRDRFGEFVAEKAQEWERQLS